MQIEACPHCGDTDCDTDCGERALIYREHRRNQLADIEIDPAERCPDCGAYVGDELLCDLCDQEASDA